MRSIVQLAPGERRSCIGCHESRTKSPTRGVRPTGVRLAHVQRATWEGAPFSYERVVQPVLDKHCVRCHNSASGDGLDLTGSLAEDRVPESYRTIISQGLVHYHDWSYNPGGNEKAAPLTFGSVRSNLVKLVDSGHQGVRLSRDETLRLKAWIDLNCPLWPDYIHRPERPISGRVAGR
jgi:mono/diheme cytochrome c family protein